MTQPATPTHIEYIADGGTVAYTYPFPITYATELEVCINEMVQADDFHYDLTGVGDFTGGLVTFRVAPAFGAVIALRLVTPYEQLLHLVPNAPLPAVALEGQLDQIVKMVHSLEESLSRKPGLTVGVKAALRELLFPTPVPLKLWGWDAVGQAITYYDPAIITVTPSLTSHMSYGETEVDVPSVNGAMFLEAPGVFPAGCVRLSTIVRVTTTFGDAGGLTTIAVGDAETVDLWAAAMLRTAVVLPDGSNNPGLWNNWSPKNIRTAESVFLTANAGTFDLVGSARVLGTYMIFLPS